MTDNINMIGVWTIESFNLLTGIKESFVFKNKITQGFYTLVHRFFSQDLLTVLNDDMNLTHLGIGDDGTATVRADTTLYNEVERAGIATKTFTDDKYTINIFLGTSQGNMTGGYIRELGIFAKATSTLDSGTMISRAVVNIQKNENIKLTMKWTMEGVN